MHKLLFDQNLSYKILNQLKPFFSPQSSHVRLLHLEETDDLTIWSYAKEHNFHIVTQDSDFNDLPTLYGFPPKIIWVNKGNMTTREIVDLIEVRQEIINAFLDNKTTGLLELT